VKLFVPRFEQPGNRSDTRRTQQKTGIYGVRRLPGGTKGVNSLHFDLLTGLKNHNRLLFEGIMANNLSIFSFFAGSGLLDLGFEDNGYNVVFVNEFSKSFLNAYKFVREKNNYQQPKYGYSNDNIEDYLYDGKNILLQQQLKKEKKLDNLIGFIGGPPCPDFSIGGKNRGENGDNGKLTGTYFSLICDLEPDFFIFENVKGLWRTKKHRNFFEEMKKMFLQKNI
jgi:site-specific DNA-cytosine methylase